MKTEPIRILIVDDEPDIARVLTLHLEDFGYDTLWADSGEKALKILETESFSLALFDVRMPGINGVELLETVKASYPDLPVIMMTAYGGERMAVDCMKIGAADYLPKPFALDSVMDRIQRVITLYRAEAEQKRLRNMVMEQGYRMEAILNGIGDMLMVIDLQGRIISASRSLSDFLGRDQRVIVGELLSEVIPAESSSATLPSFDVLKSGEQCPEREMTLTLGERSLTVLSHAAPLRDAAGNLAGCVEILHNITLRKELERQKEDFLSMLSHDLRNPITSISGSIELIREKKLGPINEEQEEFLLAAIESCSEMSELIENLLDLHRLELGRMPVRPELIEPNELLAQLAERFTAAARLAEITLLGSIAPNLPTVNLDRVKLSRIVGNLLGNALKFTPSGGEVTLGCRVPTAGDYEHIPDEYREFPFIAAKAPAILVSVRDTGEGIPPEDLGIIFERYVQARNRDPRGRGGAGLGLAFCKLMTGQFGGIIWAESTPGTGSTFYLLLPATT